MLVESILFIREGKKKKEEEEDKKKRMEPPYTAWALDKLEWKTSSIQSKNTS